MPQSKQRNSLLNRPVPESAKRRRENAKYVKYPKTSRAARSGAAAAAWKLVHTTKKRASERTLTSQWPSCPADAPLAAHRFCRGASPRNASDSWAKPGSLAGGVGWGGGGRRGKKATQKCEFGSKRTRGGKRTEAWRRKHAHTQKFCGSSANSALHAELLCGGRHAAKKVFIYNTVALSSSGFIIIIINNPNKTQSN